MSTRVFAVAAVSTALAVAGAIAQVRGNAPQKAASTQAAYGITAVPGIKVGQYTMPGRPTGCTVVMVAGEGAVGGVSQRGGAPGTRETDLLDPANMVDKVNAIVLAGGSAFGLDAATGVVKYLDEHRIGWNVGAAGAVPIVPAAILFDLGFGGDPKIRPNADCGYRAAESATIGPVSEGNFGAGAGATVGKIGGSRGAMKGGIGTASVALPSGLIVGAIAAVNAVGDIIDPETNRVVAGMRSADGKSLVDARQAIRSGALERAAAPRAGDNTTIVVVATNAKLTKAEISRVAIMADDGFARAIAPSHTVGDGDTVFTLAAGSWPGTANPTIVGALAADAVSEAIVRAVSKAESLGGVPAARELGTVPARIK
jgi:L-aminopeptidase/D-esterase-like protein